MSVYFNFMTEVKYQGKWLGICWQMKGPTGKMHPQYNCSINQHDLGSIIKYGSRDILNFDDLAKETQETILGYYDTEAEDLDGNKIIKDSTEILDDAQQHNYFYMSKDRIKEIMRTKPEDQNELISHNRITMVLNEQLDSFRMIYGQEPEDIRLIVHVE